MAYNHSVKNRGEKVLAEPTETAPGRVRALHVTKGWRYTRIAPLRYRKRTNFAQRFYAALGGLWS